MSDKYFCNINSIGYKEFTANGFCANYNLSNEQDRRYLAEEIAENYINAGCVENSDFPIVVDLYLNEADALAGHVFISLDVELSYKPSFHARHKKN